LDLGPIAGVVALPWRRFGTRNDRGERHVNAVQEWTEVTRISARSRDPPLPFAVTGARCAGGIDRVLDRSEERLAVKRFAQVRAGTGGEAARLHPRLIVTRDDYGREMPAGPSKLPLQSKTVHTRHLQVEHEAVGNGGRQRVEKILCRSEGIGVVVGRTQQALKRFADGWVVVDNSDAAAGFGHGMPSIPDRRGRWNIRPWSHKGDGSEASYSAWRRYRLGVSSGKGRGREPGPGAAIPNRSAIRTSPASDGAAIFSMTRAR
jgi:hypothetical protein